MFCHWYVGIFTRIIVSRIHCGKMPCCDNLDREKVRVIKSCGIAHFDTLYSITDNPMQNLSTKRKMRKNNDGADSRKHSDQTVDQLMEQAFHVVQNSMQSLCRKQPPTRLTWQNLYKIIVQNQLRQKLPVCTISHCDVVMNEPYLLGQFHFDLSSTMKNAVHAHVCRIQRSLGFDPNHLENEVPIHTRQSLLNSKYPCTLYMPIVERSADPQRRY
jgi:hypothetical protein